MEDIILHRLPYLDYESVINCRRVNETWKTLINSNRRFWIRELHLLKDEKIYADDKTVCDAFEDWKAVFDFFENEVETRKLRHFVCALKGADYALRFSIRLKSFAQFVPCSVTISNQYYI